MQSALPNDVLCPICHERHVLAMSYSVKYPHAASLVPDDELESIVMTPDQCVLKDTNFYLRGRFPVPVHGVEEPFIWGVWAHVSPKNFLRTQELWTTEGRENEPAFTGYLNNEIPLYGHTIDLELDVRTQPVGRRPHFFVRNPGHPLAIEQRDGLSLQRLEEITIAMAHPATSS